uniref:SERPIN domain-containing protein n=1 Tax=Strongyloides venezuelensis TaxID=75913 RepID=A0A0K0FBZ7_STRVS
MSSIPLLTTHANFAIKTLTKIIEDNKEPTSVIYSPISVGIALAMAYVGSSGETKEQIKKHLVGDFDDEELHLKFNEFLNNISKNEEFSLECVNKIYVKDGFSLLDTYTQTIMKYYNGQFEQINFTDPNSCDKINDYVKKATNNIIENLISEGDLDELTRLILINAIYFKGKWRVKFDKSNTIEEDFYVTKDVTKKVKMMTKKDKYQYCENEDYQILKLYYEGEEHSMIILLPKEKCSLIEKLPSLDGQLLFDLQFEFEDNVPVTVYLPKFKTESTHILNEPFISLGMDVPFSDKADFSLISEEEPLNISKVIQKAFIEVDEEGVEAAAATAITMCFRACAPSRPPPEQIFRADHPFIYFILDNYNNILFSGIYQ